MTTKIVPKKRIEIIDALRGFALMGILILHSMEHFELYIHPVADSPVLAWFDEKLQSIVWFLFAGKSYAIFSLLFGLSFFIQMKNQQERGIDFRGRFLWRMVLLYALGYINGLMYLGEIFEVYALLGMLLVPLFRVKDKWLIFLSLFLIFQIPYLGLFVYNLLSPDNPFILFPEYERFIEEAYATSNQIYQYGSFLDVLDYNLWSAHFQKWAWFVGGTRIWQLVGLFIVGLLIGRHGIHRDRRKMIRYSRYALALGALLFVVFSSLSAVLPVMGVNPENAKMGCMIFDHYVEMGMMLLIIGLFVQAYFLLGAKRVLDHLAPFGRMSVTNYMSQSVIGAVMYYGYGFGLAAKWGFTYCFLAGVILFLIQVSWSKWWLKRYYYGPMEWVWRCLTWGSFKSVPFKRRAI